MRIDVGAWIEVGVSLSLFGLLGAEDARRNVHRRVNTLKACRKTRRETDKLAMEIAALKDKIAEGK